MFIKPNLPYRMPLRLNVKKVQEERGNLGFWLRGAFISLSLPDIQVCAVEHNMKKFIVSVE